MRRITAAAIAVLALSACSRTGTLEGDVYVITQDGTVKRGVGARVYLVPERAAEGLTTTVDTLCTEAARRQQAYRENRQAAILDHIRFVEQRADSLKQAAEHLPPAERLKLLRATDSMLVTAYDWRDRERLALASQLPLGTAGANWLHRGLQTAYAGAAVDTAKANVDAHYILDGVPRGTYMLVAFTEPRITDGFDLLGWRAEVEVPGGLRRQDLDNDVRLYGVGICPHGGAPTPVTDAN